MAAGLAHLSRRGEHAGLGPWWPRAAAALSVGIALWLNLAASPMPPFPRAHHAYRPPSPRYRHLYELAARVPPGASMAAPDHVFPHVSHRPVLWRYRGRDAVRGEPDYYLLDATTGAGRLSPDDLAGLVNARGYSLEAVSGRFALLQRGGHRVRFQDFRDLFFLLEVESTSRQVGEDVAERGASSGLARRAVNARDSAQLVSFGRAWPLGAGEYRCQARVRNPSPTRPGTGTFVALDMASGAELERQRFRLGPGQEWTVVELALALPDPRSVEIRLIVDAGSAITADLIAFDGPAVRASFASLFPRAAEQTISRYELAPAR
jgi:hypothetical protein